MKTSNYFAITALLVGMAMLASARPRFERRELQTGQGILEDALKLHSRKATDGKESKEKENEGEKKPDFLTRLFDLKEHESTHNPVDTKTTPTKLPTLEQNGSWPSDAVIDSSLQPKKRVRRRCSPPGFWGCPTSSTIVHKHRHHKHAFNRPIY